MISIAHRLRFVARMAGNERLAKLDHALRIHPTASRALLESVHAGKVAEALAVICDALGFETLDHTRRLLAWGDALAVAAGLGVADRQDLRLGTLAHDVGKLSIEDEVLLSPAVLNPTDLDRIHLHPSMGHAILSGLPDLRNAGQLVLCHHEYRDGSGYPDGRRDTEIPRVAQVFAIVDSYEAMIRDDRPFRAGVQHELAFEELRRLAGIRYDAGLTDILLRSDAQEWQELGMKATSGEVKTCLWSGIAA
jgi:HD-GYP domain-containing protein (c-di-GMP phosphodiesterase class II)